MGLGRLWYDHNQLNLQPLGLESVQLEERLLEKTDQSIWFALSISDSPEELLARVDELRDRGCTVVLVARDAQTIGAIAVTDTVRPEAREAIAVARRLVAGANAMHAGDLPRAGAVFIAVELGCYIKGLALCVEQLLGRQASRHIVRVVERVLGVRCIGA